MAVRCLFSEDWIGRFPKGDICQGLQFTHGWRGKLTDAKSPESSENILR